MNTDNLLRMQHFCPQTFYLKNKNNEIKFDLIGKFEDLENDFHIVAHKLNIDKKLFILNKSNTNKSNYRDEYTKEMIKIVNDLYHEDFEYLG